MKCLVEDCEDQATRREWCEKHYRRWRKHGDPTTLLRIEHGIQEIWILAHYLDNPLGPCAVYPFGLNPNGYGSSFHINGRRVSPHAYATELRDGPCPEGMEAIHGPCHNRACIIHTRWGTHAENAKDMIRDGTSNRGERSNAAILTEKNVLEIRQLYLKGETKAAIARKFNVSFSTISRVVNYKTWEWLT